MDRKHYVKKVRSVLMTFLVLVAIGSLIFIIHGATNLGGGEKDGIKYIIGGICTADLGLTVYYIGMLFVELTNNIADLTTHTLNISSNSEKTGNQNNWNDDVPKI